MIKKFEGNDFDNIVDQITDFLRKYNYTALCTDTTIFDSGKITVLLTYTNITYENA